MLSQRNINAVNDFDTFETTEDRLTFLIHIPIHAGCGNKPATEKTTVITTEKSAWQSWIKDNLLTEKHRLGWQNE